MDLVTAAEKYNGIKAPNNLDVDAHLKPGGHLPGSWVLGTGAIYEAPNKKFKDEVRSDGLFFQVPQKYRGLKDAVLVFQSGFRINKETGLYTGEVTHVVEEFPVSDGWYAVHKETGIPQGKKIPYDDENARYSYRRNDDSYIGAVARGYDDFDSGLGVEFIIRDWRDVVLGFKSDDFGLRVALFSQAEPEQTAVQVQSWTAALRREAEVVEPVLSKLAPSTSPEDFENLKRLVRRAKEQE